MTANDRHPIDVQPEPRQARGAAVRAAAGFTLIELMVAMVVSGIVVMGIFAYSSIQQSNVDGYQRGVQVQQALEGAMWSMGQDINNAGLGFARACSELRVWDSLSGRLVNPGGPATPADAAIDPVTGQAYWVLRDGIQGHWNSDGAASLEGTDASSASTTSAADSFDVVLAEANYLQSQGVFTLDVAVSAGDTHLEVRTGTALDNTQHLADVQQLFPPGSFVIVARTPTAGAVPFRPANQGQCVLLQVTGDVEAGGDAQVWRIPIGSASGFNADLGALFTDTNGNPCSGDESCDDWDPDATDNQVGASVLPLGRLRWSRYEIDYTIETMPYLVRYDIIGFQEGDPASLGSVDYPHCAAGECTAAQLHLPGGDSPPQAIAIGPMIEDLQIAVGCDGYTVAGSSEPTTAVPVPDPGYEEVGPAEGVYAGQPNRTVDEDSVVSGSRQSDEWLGNASAESWAPDCVWHGSAEYAVSDWETVEGASDPPPAFRMSPQTLRVTIVGAPEGAEAAGGLTSANVPAIEDRPEMASPVGVRQRRTLSERFAPKNLRWRDPLVQ